MSFQSATDRKNVYDECMTTHSTQEYIDAEAAARVASIEGHYGRVILNWCNAESDSPDATTSNLTLNILNQVSSNWANTQESALQTAGYIVTRNPPTFTISLPE